MASVKAKVFDSPDEPITIENIQINYESLIYIFMILTTLMFIRKLTLCACRKFCPSPQAKHD